MANDQVLAPKGIEPAIIQPVPLTEPEPSGYAPMLQGAGSNKLSQITTRSTPPDVDAITGVAIITDGEYKVFIEKYSELAGGLRISTHKLLDACTIALTAQNHYRGDGITTTGVIIPLDEYVRLLGKPSTKATRDEVRKRVKEDLETLFSISIEWTEKGQKKNRDFSKMRIVTSQGIKRGNILLGFSPEFAKYLTGAYIMQYPTALLKIDERNPNSYHLGRKLLLHRSIDNNIRKGTSNLISVRALLDVCPDIPTYEEVMSGDRAVDRRIKTPFENALTALDFITWEYSNAKGVPLADEQLHHGTYADFITLFIKFEVKDFPDQTPRLESRSDESGNKETKKHKFSKKKMAASASPVRPRHARD